MRRVLCMFAGLMAIAVSVSAHARESGAAEIPFERAVDLRPFERLAVHMDGRIRSFESHASTLIRNVSGAQRIDGRSPGFTYLDMMLRPERYEEKVASIFVRNKLVRADLRRTLEQSFEDQMVHLRQTSHGMMDVERENALRADFRRQMQTFQNTGLIAPILLRDEMVVRQLRVMSADVLRTARTVEQIGSAMAIREPEFLAGRLNLLPPPAGGFDQSWHTLDELARAGDRGFARDIPAETRRQLVEAWSDLRLSWRREHAPGVNDAAIRLAELLPQVNVGGEVYPSASRLAWESWYFRSRNMVWVWLIYGLSLVPLLLFVVFRWPAARWAGLGIFLIAFAFHTFSVMLRWYVSGRWPNSNMFEAVTTAAWFGSCFAVIWELFLRRSPIRCMVAIASAACSAVALMCAHFFPMYLDPNISNMMPVLHDLWLYIHTNVIIFSYALIFMAAISAGLYLLRRLVMWMQDEQGRFAYATAGGAASLIMVGSGGTGSRLEGKKNSLGQVLDGTTMILMELSFILLWAGLVMGAIWADHSWGRPWGWDPKEVFALNTFIVFLVLVHIRFRVRDKGLWTAIIAIIGAAVMLFNWVIINFTIAGLHSYA